MCRMLSVCLAVALWPSAITAQETTGGRSLFDHLAGTWVLRGTIAGQQTTHDVDAQLVLNRGYVRLHEVSREKDAKGGPAYEAIVFISVDQKSGEYSCLWLDSTSSEGLSAAGIAHGRASGNSIPFLFKSGNGDVFHTTFIYLPGEDAWQWEMDGESGGRLQPFARVTLTRK